MSTILMSIKPQYVKRIFEGTKKYEYRKTKCKDKTDKIIVYSSSPIKKVVGELIIEDVLYDLKENIWNETSFYSGVTKEQFDNYYSNTEYAVAYKIKDFIQYEKYKELKDYNIKMAPQSYVYINKK